MSNLICYLSELVYQTGFWLFLFCLWHLLGMLVCLLITFCAMSRSWARGNDVLLVEAVAALMLMTASWCGIVILLMTTLTDYGSPVLIRGKRQADDDQLND